MLIKNHKGGALYGVIALIALTVVTTLCFIPIIFIGILKLFPHSTWRRHCTAGIDRVAMVWTGLTTGYVKRFCLLQWNITGGIEWQPKQWYLVISNHQSWLDIVILQNYFYQKIPVLKFFIKEQLKWVPLFGLAWWAMGCPFMKRYSKEYLQKYPHRKGEDLKATHRALQGFKSYPSSIISFVEGTRYTPQKQQHQRSPYAHLLKPKAGGISQVISAMGSQLQPIVDVTIDYANVTPSLWNFLCRRMDTVNLNVRSLPVPEVFTQTSTAIENEDTQSAFRAWLNERWAEKDAWIRSLRITHT